MQTTSGIIQGAAVPTIEATFKIARLIKTPAFQKLWNEDRDAAVLEAQRVAGCRIGRSVVRRISAQVDGQLSSRKRRATKQPECAQAIIRARADGRLLREIAAEFQISITRAHRILKKFSAQNFGKRAK